VKLLAVHNYTKDKSLAAEVSRPVQGGDVNFTLGISQKLENGALFKAKVGGCLQQWATDKTGRGCVGR